MHKMFYTTRIAADISNEPGSLGQVATIIGRHNGNIANLSAIQRKTDFYRFEIDLDVYDLEHLQQILRALSTSPHISQITRVRNKDGI